VSDNGKEPDNDQTPFERFEQLTKRLVAVPKAEIDAARKREARKKRHADRIGKGA
jgi:hypothetical protein